MQTHVGTKELIERYYDELCACLETLRAWGATSAAARAACLPFWQQARVGFGNTALLLSGGAMLGCYHYGVVRALLERRMLPRVICGTSAGAVIAAFLATRTDEEALADLRGLDRLFREQGSNGPLHGSHWWKLKRLLRHGVLYETADFLRHMDWFAKGCTFREVRRAPRARGAAGARRGARRPPCAACAHISPRRRRRLPHAPRRPAGPARPGGRRT